MEDSLIDQPQPSEDRIQSDCYIWFHNTYPKYRGLLFKVTNEVHRHAKETTIQFVARITRLKATGLVPGVADMILLFPLNCFEFKTPEGRQGEDQIVWEARVRAVNIPYHIVRSLEEFQALIRQIVSSAAQ